MRQLYKIRSEILDACDLMEHAQTDEGMAAANEALAQLSEDFETKIENIYKVILDYQGSINMLKEEENRLKARRESMQNAVERLKAYTAREMEAIGQKKVKTVFCTARLQMNPPKLVVLNDEKIPIKFYVPQPGKLDKTAVRDYLKAGHTIEGVVLSQTESLRFDNRKAEEENE